METKRLGQEGPALSRLGLGTWLFGGPWRFGWGRIDADEALATIRSALDLGINWIDTAPVYGLGFAERLVGRALKGNRDRVFISSKCGLVWQKEIKKRPHNLTPENIRRECEESLRRLKTDRIDLYQCHAPDPETPLEKTWQTMLELKQQGKVRWIGLSNFNADQIAYCDKMGRVDFVQPQYNLLDRSIEQTVLPYCRSENIGVISYSPLASGRLSGRFDPSKLAVDDWRRKDDDFLYPKLQKVDGLLGRLEPVAKRVNLSLPQLAIAWVLAREEITSAIIGVRNRGQLEQNVRAAEQPLTGELLEEIDNLLTE